jgi:hypothetical protein
MVGKRDVDNIDNVRLEIISIQSPNKRFLHGIIKIHATPPCPNYRTTCSNLYKICAKSPLGFVQHKNVQAVCFVTLRVKT